MEEMKKVFFEEAKELFDEMTGWRRTLHSRPELLCELPETTAFVKARLGEMGYEPEEITASGLSALLNGKDDGKCFLLRADMDALPMNEDTDYPFKSEIPGRGHCCGHDLHTAQLLGAAKILMRHKDCINGKVKFMFQPGEEGGYGGAKMVEAGILENPKVDAAIAIHTLVNMHHPTGVTGIALKGPAKASSDKFTVRVSGRGCHAAMPENGDDIVNVLCKIQQGIQTIKYSEIPAWELAVTSVCGIHAGGTAFNIYPETGDLIGTVRAFNEDIRLFIKRRIFEITEGIAKAYGVHAEVEYEEGYKSTINDVTLAYEMKDYVSDLLGEDHVFEEAPIMGADDFCEITQRVPGVYLDTSFGSLEQGYLYGGHTPQVRFDEEGMIFGAAIYAYCAYRWLKEH